MDHGDHGEHREHDGASCGVALTVLGNLSVDLIDGGAPSAGGCPAFALEALAGLGGSGRVVTRAAAAERALLDAVGGESEVAYDVLPARTTSSFALRYRGEERSVTVVAAGPVWEPADLAEAGIGSRWVHVSPLLRSDFPTATLRALVTAGHIVSYDGQGLVRRQEVGPLRVDARFDPGILELLQVLKLADDEAEVLAGGRFDAASARALGVPEVLVTHGSAGYDLYVDGERLPVAAVRPVVDVDPTGAGDMFAVAYAAGRAMGAPPVTAAQRAAQLVADRLTARAGLSSDRTATTSWS
jgi:sugar/nucleoside kinase (ribokinase family)